MTRRLAFVLVLLAPATAAGSTSTPTGTIAFATNLTPAQLRGEEIWDSKIFSVGAGGTPRRPEPNPGYTGLGDSLSPDGRSAASASEDGVFVSTASGERALLTGDSAHGFGGEGLAPPAWSPDGRLLAVTEYSLCKQAPSSAEPCVDFSVLVVDLEGTVSTRLFDARNPSWSPDGRRLAVETDIDPYQESESIAIVGADGKSARRLVGPDGIWSLPAWSPDGRYIAFNEGNADEGEATYVVRTDGKGRPVKVASAAGQVWSPDSKRLAVVAYHFDEADHAVGTLFSVRRDGTGRRRLSDPRRSAKSPLWSPDGSRIAFSYVFGAREQLATEPAGGGRIRRLTSEPTADLAPIRWRSGRIAYVRTLVPGAQRIWLAAADGKGLRPLTPELTADVGDPAWTSTGLRLAYVRFRVDPGSVLAGDIWTIGRDGRGDRRLTDGMSPSWSPDGGSLAFARKGDVYVRTGNRERRLTRGVGTASCAWSPDGRRIAFAGGGGIEAIRPDGTGRETLAKPPDGALYPVWSPRGATIAFVSNGDLELLDVRSGAIRKVADRPVGAPAWSPDGTTLAYSSAAPDYSSDGALLAVGVDGSPARTILDVHARSTTLAWTGR